MIELTEKIGSYSKEDLSLILQGIKLSYDVFNGQIETEKVLTMEISETREDFKVTLNYVFGQKDDKEQDPQIRKDIEFYKDCKKIKLSKSEMIKELVCAFESELNEIGNIKYEYQ